MERAARDGPVYPLDEVTVLGVGASLLISVVSYELFEKRFLVLKRFFAPEMSGAMASPARAIVVPGAVERRLD